MSMGVVASSAIAFCFLMIGLTLFQCALIAGAPLGHLAWGGQDRVLPKPKRIGSGASILLYAVFTLVVLQRAGLVSLIPWHGAVSVATWVLAGYFMLGIALNAISRSRPERWTMAPLSAVLAALTIVVALS
jgi:hypothetical protein